MPWATRNGGDMNAQIRADAAPLGPVANVSTWDCLHDRVTDSAMLACPSAIEEFLTSCTGLV